MAVVVALVVVGVLLVGMIVMIEMDLPSGVDVVDLVPRSQLILLSLLRLVLPLRLKHRSLSMILPLGLCLGSLWGLSKGQV